MIMLKYKCLKCGRIHYGREDLNPGYCTTCGPKGRLIYIINWKKVSENMASCIEGATESIRNLGEAMGNITKNIDIERVAKAVLDNSGRTISRGIVE